MATTVTDYGTKSYNGVSFSVEARYNYSYELEYNEGKTAVIGRRYRLDVWDYVGGGAVTDSAFTTIKDALSEPRKALSFANVGMGVLQTGGAFGVDLDNGPHPKIAEWFPVGAHNCCYYHWRVTGLVDNCSGSDDIVAFEYKTRFSQDQDLINSIVYKGYLRVRPEISGNVLTRTADDFRSLIAIPLPRGFRRQEPVFDIDYEKHTLRFTITDVELEEALPPGVTDAKGKHTVTSKDVARLGQAKFASILSATFRIAPGRTKADAYRAFSWLVVDRLMAVNDTGGNVYFDNQGQQQQVLPVFTHVEFEESLWRRECSFSTAWVVTTNILNAVRATGLFQPIPGSDDGEWRAALPGMTDPDGSLGAHHSSGDFIVSLCDSQVPNTNVGLGGRSGGGGSFEALSSGGPQVVRFEMWLEQTREHNTVMHKQSPLEEMSSGSQGESANGEFFGVPSPGDYPMSEYDDPVQSLATATPVVSLCMVAVSLGEPVAIPKIEKVGGGTPVSVGEDFVIQKCNGAFMGNPIFVTGCRKTVALRSKPTGPTTIAYGQLAGQDPKRFSADSLTNSQIRRGAPRGGTFANGTFAGGPGGQFSSGRFTSSGPAFQSLSVR